MRDVVRIRVQGSPTFVINMLRNNNIAVLEVDREESATIFSISPKDRKNTEKLLLDAARDYEVLGRLGGVFLAKKLFMRVGIWLGIAIVACAVYVYSQYVFGCSIVSRDLSFVDQAYIVLEEVSFPEKKSAIDLDTIEARAYELDGVSYATATIYGARLKLEIVGTAQPHDIIDLAKPCDLVATSDAIVTKVVTYQGTPVVSIGDVVARGSTLISGNIAITEELSIDVAAAGEVYGLVYHQERIMVPKTTIKRTRTGASSTRTAVGYLKWDRETTSPYDNYDVEVEVICELPLLNLYVKKYTYHEVAIEEHAIDWDSQSKGIIEGAYAALEARLPEDATIHNRDCKVKKLDNYYLLELYYQTEEKIYEGKNY